MASARPGRAIVREAATAISRTRWQVGLAAAAGISAAGIPAAVEGEAAYTHLEARGEYIAFLLGLASILALVATITFGFLLHFIQSVTSERYLLYGRFKEGVRGLREFLDGLRDEGVIDDSFDFHFGAIDEIGLADLPVLDWGERAALLVEWVEEQEELLDEPEWGRLIRGFVYRGGDIEEVLQGLTINWLEQITVTRTLDPVLKAFATLAVVLLCVIVAAVAYTGVAVTILWGAAMALSAMTLVLVLQIGVIAWRETRHVMEIAGLGRESAEEEPEDEETPEAAAPAAP